MQLSPGLHHIMGIMWYTEWMIYIDNCFLHYTWID